MEFIKTYESFDQDLNFEFLATMGSVEKALIKIVKVHELKYYQKENISTSNLFISRVKKWIQKGINKNKLITDDFLEIIRSFEEDIYQKNKFRIFETDESLFGIIDDLIYLVEKIQEEISQENIQDLEEECEHILNYMDISWTYQSGEDVSVDLSILIKDLNVYVPWCDEMEFILDLEKRIGKNWEFFNYSDKLKSYEYLKNLPFLQELEDDNREDILEQFQLFLGI